MSATRAPQARRRRLVVAAAAVIVVVLVVVVVVVVVGGSRGGTEPTGGGRPAPVPSADPQTLARTAGERFLDRYLDDDGRVVRHDQGGDTVSEGQAYAMLIAAALGDERRFDLAWGWTRANLRRSDGLLSYLWRDGHVEDPQAAADADLDAARALVLAGRRFDRPALVHDAAQLGRAILAGEIVQTGGSTVLVAGPWATTTAPPPVDPSYFAPRAYALLDEVAPDPRWAALAQSSRALARTLVAGDDNRLPPDWARLRPDGTAQAAPPPGQSDQPITYGFDAARLPVRFAESCTTADHAVAAASWPFLRDIAPEDLVARYQLDNGESSGGPHPVASAGAAAAAAAAGDDAARDRQLAQADRLENDHSTYYGAAWAALGRIMLTTDLLGRC
jgi:endo-1,4-beta-D-glucanase Y